MTQWLKSRSLGQILSYATILCVLVALAGVALWSAARAQPVGVQDFLDTCDVDGDGIHTVGDRAVMEWWINHGGSANTAMLNAVSSAGIQDVTAFLASPQAQLGD